MLRSLSAEVKLVAVVALASVAAGVAAAALVGARYESGVEAAGQRALTSAAEDFAARQRAETAKLAAALDALMASVELRAAFLARDRALLQRRAAPVLAVLKERDRVTHLYFHLPEPSPRVFLRVHKPDLFDDTPVRATLRAVAEGADLGAGLELGKTAFALRAVRPWQADGKLIGYVELAEEIDHVLEATEGRGGDQLVLLVKKRYLDQAAWAAAVGARAASWNDRDDLLVAGGTGPGDALGGWAGEVDALPEDGLRLPELLRGEQALLRAAFPLKDAAGRRVGALVVVHDFSGFHQALAAARTWTLAGLLLAALAAATCVAVLLRLLVFRRLHRLRERLERRVADATPSGRPGQMRSHDDVGRLETLFERAVPDAPQPPRGRDPGDGPLDAAG